MIPVFKPILSGDEKRYLLECVKDKWFSSNGKFNLKLENNFKQKIKRKYASSVSNGTVALEIAIRSLELPKNSEVIVPTFTIISPILAILKNNLKPILIDSTRELWSMDVSQIEKKINSKTKAILVVHTYGFPADMEKINYLKKKYKLKVIEDAAEMHGQNYKNKPCGSFGDVSTFSFYSNKFISSGEGGIVCTNNINIKKKVDYLRNLCFGKKNRFVHEDLGYNFRLSNLQAAVAYSQIRNLEKIVKIKRKIGKLYNNLLKNNKFIEILPYRNSFSENIYWVYGIILKKGSKKKFTKYLRDHKIETRDFFVGMHNQPILKKMKIFSKDKFPISDYLEAKGLYIPSGPQISVKEIRYICKIINNYFS